MGIQKQRVNSVNIDRPVFSSRFRAKGGKFTHGFINLFPEQARCRHKEIKGSDGEKEIGVTSVI